MFKLKLFKYELILKVYEYLIKYRLIHTCKQYSVNYLYTNKMDNEIEYNI